ncbi:hypothetical protein ACH5RR_014837 [Cinchona calisaya]|uniref:Endonuclease/exonuclease/phosphatase n=1 Tax=Cinchona calisaya TaxID=153742 RepID=A0ABD2ZWP1_9GENT
MYGELNVGKRKKWWLNFQKLKDTSTLPWVCIGDFNEAPDTARGRLDRACVTNSWLAIYPTSTLTHIFLHRSDHRPILLKASKQSDLAPRGRFKRFRFEAIWIQSNTCEEIIKSCWEEGHSLDGGTDLLEKRDRCKVGFLQWNKMKFGNIQRNAEVIRKQFKKLHGEERTDMVKARIGELKA